MSRLLTTSQAASLLSVSRRTITNWIRDARVPYVRLPGGEYRLPLDGLLDSLTGTYDIRALVEDAGLPDEVGLLEDAADSRQAMAERLARVHALSKQMTSIAGVARDDG